MPRQRPYYMHCYLALSWDLAFGVVPFIIAVIVVEKIIVDFGFLFLSYKYIMLKDKTIFVNFALY